MKSQISFDELTEIVRSSRDQLNELRVARSTDELEPSNIKEIRALEETDHSN